ncbi:MAG: ribosomal protein S18-alanine N-acetyltransferase [Cyanobacteriota bacterium]|nr:ribosomal protein S18-alanine N-acetyltransferase [Cyanobacteriota bacterium]
MQSELETITIRRMEPQDVDGIIAIEEKAYGDHHWSKESFLNELNNELAYYYVLFNSEGILVGYAGSWHILDEAHITNIAISADFRRRKYGEALLKRIIDDCYKEKIKYITLEVRVSNTPAINLYSKYGFTSFGTRKGYYQDNNEDAMIMWTKNIFFDEFKILYEKIVKDLEEKIIIK